MGQVDRLTSCAPEYLSIAVPWSDLSKSRKTPSPPCYLISATSHTGTLCTLYSSVSKYKTTGRDAVYLIWESWFIFFHVESMIISNELQLFDKNISGSTWQWNWAARWCHLYFRTDTNGLYSYLTVLGIPPAEHKKGRDKTSNQL